MRGAGRALAAIALLLLASGAAAQNLTFRVDPGSAALVGTFDALDTASGPFSLTGTILADVTFAAGGATVAELEITGGSLMLTQGAALQVEFGDGFGKDGGPHLSLALTSTPIQAVLTSPAVEATPTGPRTSEASLAGLSIDLVAGSYGVNGSALGSPVAFAHDFGAAPFELTVSTGVATLVVTQSSNPDEVTLVLPVTLGMLALPSPLYAPLRLVGTLVLRAPVCAACPPACNDGIDNDGDGAVDLADPGCSSAADTSERDASLPCDDAFDNDGDGYFDARTDGSGDPACLTASSPRENSQCQDGIDNDGHTGTDFDGGVSILGAGHGDPSGPDPQCAGKPARNREAASSCGLGGEGGLALGLLLALLRRRRR